MFNTCVSSWACKKTVALVTVYHITCYCILNIITLCLLSDCLWGVIGGTDNLEYYFFYCHFVKHFWDQVENWLFSKFQIRIKFTALEVLLGVNTNHFYFPVNYIILIGKYFIYKCKKMTENCFNCFLYTLKYHHSIKLI